MTTALLEAVELLNRSRLSEELVTKVRPFGWSFASPILFVDRSEKVAPRLEQPAGSVLSELNLFAPLIVATLFLPYDSGGRCARHLLLEKGNTRQAS